MSLLRPLARLVARAKPRIPAAVWPTLLALRSLPGDGPVVGLPAFDHALVLVAHPDDEALACAGTMALLSDAGATVTLLAATDGEGTIGSPHDPAETGRRRRAELGRSAALLGAAVEHLGLPDGALDDHRPAMLEAFAAAIERLRPDVVFAPWLGDGHRDHRAVAFALADALARTTPDLQVWGYETWSAVPHNRVVPVEEVIDRKRAAVAAHETGALAFDLSAGLGLSRWRSMHGLMGEGHAEAFLAADVPTYVDLARQLAALDDAAPERRVSDDVAADLVLRAADRSDDAELRRLNADAFPTNPKTRADITAWQWWDNPFGDTIAHVWEDAGRIVGQYVAYRIPASFDGQPGRIAIGVDLAIASSHRGQGLAGPLIDACFGQATAEDTPFYSYPNELSVGGVARGGWVQVDQLEVRVLPTDAAALADQVRQLDVVQGAGAAGRVVASLAGVAARLPVRALGSRVRMPSGVSVEIVDEPPDDVDALWSAVARHHPWGVARGVDWWRWRYAEHPDQPYRFIAARRGSTLVALSAVITHDDLGGRFHCLLELLGVDASAATAIVATLRAGALGPADGIAATSVPGSRLSELAGGAGLVRVPARLLSRPIYFGVVPHPTIVPDPTAVAWSTAWGDLDHI